MSKQPQEPSDLSPVFRWEWLKAIAQIAYDRAWWVAKHAITKDDRCGTGYRRWNLIREDISEAVLRLDWLSVPNSGAEYLFAFRGWPIRFCRADADAPLPVKYARATRTEQAQRSLLAEAGEDMPPELLYRLLVVCDRAGLYPVGIYFAAVEQDTGDIVYVWSIPVQAANDLGDDGRAAAPLVTPKPPTILPPLTLETAAEAEEVAHAMERERQEKEQAERALAAQREQHKGA